MFVILGRSLKTRRKCKVSSTLMATQVWFVIRKKSLNTNMHNKAINVRSLLLCSRSMAFKTLRFECSSVRVHTIHKSCSTFSSCRRPTKEVIQISISRFLNFVGQIYNIGLLLCEHIIMLITCVCVTQLTKNWSKKKMVRAWEHTSTTEDLKEYFTSIIQKYLLI